MKVGGWIVITKAQYDPEWAFLSRQLYEARDSLNERPDFFEEGNGLKAGICLQKFFAPIFGEDNGSAVIHFDIAAFTFDEAAKAHRRIHDRKNVGKILLLPR